MTPLGAAISAGSAIVGGMMNRAQADKSNAIQQAQARDNEKNQREFAQQGIRWRVQDAEAAGIHPLYALGAQTNSFSPVSLGTTTDTSLGSAVASAGQDVSRAMNATRTAPERESAIDKTIQDLTVQNMALKNEALAVQIAKLRNTNPPLPTLDPSANGVLPEGKLDPVTPLVASGTKLRQDRGWSDGATFEDRWGEWGGSAAGLAVMISDLLKHSSHLRQNLQAKYPFNLKSRGSFREMSLPLLGRR